MSEICKPTSFAAFVAGWTFSLLGFYPTLASALQPYLAADAAYFHGDRAAYGRGDISLGLGAGMHATPDMRVEVQYREVRLPPAHAGGIVDQQNLGLAVYWDLWRSPGLTAYGGVGAGAAFTDFDGDNETLPFGIASLGYSVPLTASGALRFENEIMGRYTVNEKELLGEREFIDALFLIRLTYGFGRLSASPPQQLPLSTPMSDALDPPSGGVETLTSDGDGDDVVGTEDRCPNTIPNVRVDADGCMAAR